MPSGPGWIGPGLVLAAVLLFGVGPGGSWRRFRYFLLVLVGTVFAAVSFVCLGRSKWGSVPQSFFVRFDLSTGDIPGRNTKSPKKTSATRNHRTGTTRGVNATGEEKEKADPPSAFPLV